MQNKLRFCFGKISAKFRENFGLISLTFRIECDTICTTKNGSCDKREVQELNMRQEADLKMVGFFSFTGDQENEI